MKANPATRISNFFVNYFSLNGQLVSQAEAEAAIRESVSFKGTSILILILAIFIASLGLNTNSTAVIIGAMLISPLMGPIIGLGLGIGVHDFELIKRCLRNLFMAAGFSVITATLYFLISPVNEEHSELLARTSPTIYDVLIGFFGGGAGIIALGSTNKGNVITGVAIATALMPPLCTAGYGLATWQMQYFLGATYLFVINSIYIAFATYIGVKLMKYKPVSAADPDRSQRVMRVVYVVAVLTMLPSIYLTYRMLQTNKFNTRVEQFVSEECHFPQTQVLSARTGIDNGQRTLSLTLIGQILPADSLQVALSERMKYYGLNDTRLIIYQGGEESERNIGMAPSLAEVYSLAQTTITRQQHSIDSLRQLLAADHTNGTAAAMVAPEIKVLFPEIRQIAVSTTLVARPSDTTRVDTVNVALVNTSKNIRSSERRKLAEYLQARLNMGEIQIVDVRSLD